MTNPVKQYEPQKKSCRAIRFLNTKKRVEELLHLFTEEYFTTDTMVGAKVNVGGEWWSIAEGDWIILHEKTNTPVGVAGDKHFRNMYVVNHT